MCTCGEVEMLGSAVLQARTVWMSCIKGILRYQPALLIAYEYLIQARFTTPLLGKTRVKDKR
jgi:hypothetical protein